MSADDFPGNDIIISGFSGDEKMFIESVREECTVFLSKLRREAPVRSLEVRMKYSMHGKSRLFEVRATARLDRSAMHASASARDLNLALRRAFSEVASQASRLSGKKSGIDAKEKRR